LLSCDPNRVSRIKEVAAKYGLSLDTLGETAPEQLEIKLDGKVVVSAAVAHLRDEYENALERALRTEPDVVAAD
jgi:hypothetical protein